MSRSSGTIGSRMIGIWISTLAAVGLVACSSGEGSEGSVATTTITPSNQSSPSSGDESTADASGSYRQECANKKATGDALLEATNLVAQALRRDDVEAARSASVAYYDVYERDVDSIVDLSRRIESDPAAPSDVVEATGESLSAAEAFDATVGAAREDLAHADGIDAIAATFEHFQDGLRGAVAPGGPQLLPPALVRWLIGDGSDCGAS